MRPSGPIATTRSELSPAIDDGAFVPEAFVPVLPSAVRRTTAPNPGQASLAKTIFPSGWIAIELSAEAPIGTMSKSPKASPSAKSEAPLVHRRSPKSRSNLPFTDLSPCSK